MTDGDRPADDTEQSGGSVGVARCDVCDTREIRHNAVVPLPPRGHRERDQVDAILCERCQDDLAEVLTTGDDR